jgi:deoxyribose-phosphate aldolase
MTDKEALLPKAQAALMDPFLPAEAARSRMETWLDLGVRHVWAQTGLLAELEPEEYPDIRFTGVVGFPSGGSTLSTKRMEVLECLRLGAKAATVVLTPGLLAAADGGRLAREMGAVLETARDLEVQFLVEASRLSEETLVLLSRLLREYRPSGLVTGSGLLAPPASPSLVKKIRRSLTRKVQVVAGPDVQDREEARAHLEAGAEGFVTSRPDLFGSGGG